MKRLTLFILSLTFTSLAFGQTIKFQAGTTISKMNWELKGVKVDPFYPETLVSYSVLAGIDYLEKKYFNLSSNLGFLRKGGKGEMVLTDENGVPTGEKIIEKPALDYLSINTLFEIKYPIKETFVPFIGAGPRIDYIINSSYHFDGLKEIDELNNVAAGLILGGGLKYELEKLQFGLRADYYLDFTKIADWYIEETMVEGVIEINAFTINLTFGYKL